MPNSEEYLVETQVINNTPVSITTYKIGEKYFCHISNTDPGATIARAEGTNRQDAIEHALKKVNKRIK